MPKIAKQVARRKRVVRKRSSGDSELADRIRPVSEVSTGLKFSVYGRGKTGKTRFGCTFPKPVLILGTEDGTKSVSTVKDVDFVQLQTSEEIEGFAKIIVAEDYKTVVLDTAGGLQDMVLREVLGLDELPIQRSWGMAKREDWQTCGAQCKERMRGLLDLADSYGTNVVIVAHERNFNDDNSDDELLAPTVGSALSPSVAGWLNGACDYICQTYIREQEGTKEVKVANKTTNVRTKTGQKEFCLRVGPHPVFMTGFRLPPGTQLPDSIVNPSYSKVFKLILG